MPPRKFFTYSEKNDDISTSVNKTSTSDEIRLLKCRSVSSVLSDITLWPKDDNSNKENKRKSRRLKLPSVVTSDKWIELMEAEEENKKIKEQKCRNKKKPVENMQQPSTPSSETALKKGVFVIVNYLQSFYPAKILNTRGNEYYCCAMMKSGRDHWRWPEKNDLLWYAINDIVMVIEEPKLANARGAFHVPEMKDLE